MTKAPRKTRSSPARSKTSKPKVKSPVGTPKVAVAAPSVAPSVVTETTPVVTAPELRKKDLIDAVVARSAMKKKDVKPLVEAMLAVLGEALAQDRELNLPPFAKLKIQKVKQLRTARVTVARLRQSTPAENTGE